MPQTTVSGYKYQWYKNGKKISDANSLQYKVTTSGEYYLLVEAGNGVKNTSNKIDVNIATERPTCNINVENGTSGLNGWYTSDVTVSLSKQSAVKYGMSIISNYEYNGITSLDLINSSTVYCFVSDSTGVKTNSNSKDIKIDKEAPIIDDFTGTKITDSSNNISYILTVSATDNGSGIDYYEFYGYNATYNLEDELGISENNTIKITGFKNGYTYKVKVYDLSGNVSEETLYESCKLETEGTCTSGTQIDTYKCDPTGRTYNVPKSCSNYSGGPSSGTGSAASRKP